MEKQALPDFLEQAGNTVSDAGHRMSDWYGDLDPATKRTLLSGLIGSAVAGGGIGLLRHFTPMEHDESAVNHTVKPALIAALLGAGAGAGIPAGVRMLGGEHSPLRPTRSGGASGAAVNTLGNVLTASPGVVAGGLIGAHQGGLLKGLFSIPKKDEALPFGHQLRKDLSEAWAERSPEGRIRKLMASIEQGPWRKDKYMRHQVKSFGGTMHKLEESMTPDFKQIFKQPLYTPGKPAPHIPLTLRGKVMSKIHALTDTVRRSPKLQAAGAATKATGKLTGYNLKRLAEVLGALKPMQRLGLAAIPAGMLAGRAIENTIKGD